MTYRAVLPVCCVLLLVGSSTVKADEWNKKTLVTLKAPLEIPGRVLEPGTYVFKLADSLADRNIVEIFNQDETHLITTVLAIPDYRLEPKDKTVMMFEERAAKAPEALKAWFYPGDLYGQEFVYPHARAVELAQRNQQNVPSMPAETKPSKNALRQAPLRVVTPHGNSVEVARAMPPKPAAPARPPSPPQAKTTAQPAPAPQPKTLPHTASSQPLVLVAGLAGLATALAATALRRRADSRRLG